MPLNNLWAQQAVEDAASEQRVAEQAAKEAADKAAAAADADKETSGMKKHCKRH